MVFILHKLRGSGGCGKYFTSCHFSKNIYFNKRHLLDPVLVSAAIELIFFLVDGTGQCLGFSINVDKTLMC